MWVADRDDAERNDSDESDERRQEDSVASAT
jgi:hypothetical protein